MYHCHVSPVMQHVRMGLYGAFICNPKNPLPPAREYVLVSGEYDTQNQLNPFPEYYMFNGYADGYLSTPLPAKTNETVRIYLINMGLSPSYGMHIHGTLFKAYPSGIWQNRREGKPPATALRGAAGGGRRCGGQPASPASGCRHRTGADRRRAGPGDRPAVSPDLGRAGHRPRLAALVPGRRPDRCGGSGRDLCPCPAARRPPRGPRPVVAHVGGRARCRHPTPWLVGRSTDAAAPRDLRRRHRRGHRVLLPGAQPGLLPEGRDGGVRDPHRRSGSPRSSRCGEATGASSERWSSRRSSAR